MPPWSEQKFEPHTTQQLCLSTTTVSLPTSEAYQLYHIYHILSIAASC